MRHVAISLQTRALEHVIIEHQDGPISHPSRLELGSLKRRQKSLNFLFAMVYPT